MCRNTANNTGIMTSDSMDVSNYSLDRPHLPEQFIGHAATLSETVRKVQGFHHPLIQDLCPYPYLKHSSNLASGMNCQARGALSSLSNLTSLCYGVLAACES
jgi:hypothetical protein